MACGRSRSQPRKGDVEGDHRGGTRCAAHATSRPLRSGPTEGRAAPLTTSAKVLRGQTAGGGHPRSAGQGRRRPTQQASPYRCPAMLSWRIGPQGILVACEPHLGRGPSPECVGGVAARYDQLQRSTASKPWCGRGEPSAWRPPTPARGRNATARSVGASATARRTRAATQEADRPPAVA